MRKIDFVWLILAIFLILAVAGNLALRSMSNTCNVNEQTNCRIYDIISVISRDSENAYKLAVMTVDELVLNAVKVESPHSRYISDNEINIRITDSVSVTVLRAGAKQWDIIQ